MPYVVFKEGNLLGKQMTVLVNDSEGIAMEFKTFDDAQKIASLFESNSTQGNKYYVKEIR
jgi:extradiol dioxygenase family protein